MNYIIHLNKVMEQFHNDTRVTPRHISLYFTLFRQWNLLHFPSWISVQRKSLMKASSIGSKSSYHRVIRDLHDWHYLVYRPSYSPQGGSKVQMTIHSPGTVPEEGQVTSDTCPLLGRYHPNMGQDTIYNKQIKLKKALPQKAEKIPVGPAENFSNQDDHLKVSKSKRYDQPL